MATRTSIKVSVANLLTRVRAARAAAIDEHNAEVAEYEAKTKAVRKAVISALETEVKRIKAGGDPELTSGRYGGSARIELPTLSDDELPYNPGDLKLSQYDRDIALLEMATDEALLVSTDSNWAKYLG